MQSVHGNTITIESNRVLLNDFQIDDSNLVGFLHKLKDEQGCTDEQLHDKLIQLLYFGLMVDKAVRIDEKIDYVREGFNSLRRDMGNQIENNFSESVKDKIDSFLGNEGSFTRKLQEIFGDDGIQSQKINELVDEYRTQMNSLLDISNEDSPLKALEMSIDEKFNHVLTFMSAREATQKAEEKSPKKGAQFEDFVFPILSDSAQFFNCNFEKTGAITGIAGDKNSKKGDFVLTERNTNKKIVIEAKNLSKAPTTKEIIKYSVAALDNREADYCVYLYYDSNDASIPEAGMFNEVAKNILFAVISESDSYEAKTRMMRLGCSWALQRIRANENSDAKLNDKLTNMQGVLRTSLNSIKTVKNNSSAITIACKQLITDFETELGLTR